MAKVTRTRKPMTPEQRTRHLARTKRRIQTILKAKTFTPVKMWGIATRGRNSITYPGVWIEREQAMKFVSQLPSWKVVPVLVRRVK